MPNETADMTPTWAAIMPTLIAALRNPDLPFKSRQQIEHEIQRCAKLADRYDKVLQQGGLSADARKGVK